MNGLWTATFGTPRGNGYGVAYFANNQVFGGDSGFTYIGSYSEFEVQITAKIRVTPYNSSSQSVFGSNQAFDLSIDGTIHGDRIVAQGKASHFPGLAFSVNLSRAH